MDGYPNTPAFVLSRTLDILAANALTDALYARSPRRTTWPA